MSCPAGVFMEKPHPLPTHAPSSAFLYPTHQQRPSRTTATAAPSGVKQDSLTNQTGKNPAHKKTPNPALFSFKPCFLSLKSWPLYLFQGPLVTVYVSKLDHGASTTIYRFSLNASIPSPWKMCSTEREVSSFQVWEQEKSQPDYIGNNSSPTKAAYN